MNAISLRGLLVETTQNTFRVGIVADLLLMTALLQICHKRLSPVTVKIPMTAEQQTGLQIILQFT